MTVMAITVRFIETLLAMYALCAANEGVLCPALALLHKNRYIRSPMIQIVSS